MEEISDIKAYAKENAVPIMQDAGIDFICDYIKNNDVHSVLEIGTAIGYSSIRFAKMRDDIKVTTIEIDMDRHIKAVQNVKDNGLDGRITLLYGNALYTDIEDKFDLIFIDGPKAQYINFFEKYKNNLTENGVFISDNLSFHGMVEDLSLTHNYSTIKLVKKIRKYIAFLKENTEFTTTFYTLGDGVAISRKNKQENK